jgi:hypothetical protein
MNNSSYNFINSDSINYSCINKINNDINKNITLKDFESLINKNNN